MGSKVIRSVLVILIVAAIEIIGAFIFYKIYSPKPRSGLSVYNNVKYGFSLEYPDKLIPQKTFKSFYHLSNKWRAEIFTDNPKGVPVVSIPIFQIDNNTGVYKSYPLYYDVEVRVGVSDDPSDVKNCLISTQESATSTIVTINGTDFWKFDLSNAGMMQYLKGYSYRTIHNNECFVMEQLATGSSYRESPNPNDISDNVLNSYFNSAGKIIESFKFTR